MINIRMLTQSHAYGLNVSRTTTGSLFEPSRNNSSIYVVHLSG